MSEGRPGLASGVAIWFGLIVIIVAGIGGVLKVSGVLGELVKKNQVQAAEIRRQNAQAHANEDYAASEKTRRKLCAERKNPGATDDACRNLN